MASRGILDVHLDVNSTRSCSALVYKLLHKLIFSLGQAGPFKSFESIAHYVS